MSQGNDSQEHELIWIMVAIMAFLLCKFVLRDFFIQYVLWVKFGWIWLMNEVHSTDFSAHSLFLIKTYKAKEWSGDNVDHLLSGVQYIIGIPLALLTLGLTIWTYSKMPGPKYKRVMDGTTLTKETLAQWPWLAPVLGKDLVNKSLHKGEWAMAKRPVEFSKQNKIYIPASHKVDQAGAYLVFSNQLGSLWRGPEKLPKGIQVFFAAMLAHFHGDKDASYKILSTTAMMFLGQDFGKTKAEQLAPWDKIMPLAKSTTKKYINSKDFQRIVKRHAYESTVLTELLERARLQGILPNSWFVGWMRPHYRRWYYMFEDVGRQTPLTESAGVHAHRLSENMLQMAIEIPFVDKAGEALQAAISETPVEYNDELPPDQRTDVDKDGSWGY
jgi:hypothetical protein